MTPSVVVGKVDRISGSGNGMLKTDSKEYNLGPLNKSAVGNTVAAVPMNNLWAFCLTPQDNIDAYHSRFRSTTGIDISEVRQQLRGKEVQQVDSVSELSPDGSVDFAVGDNIQIEIAVSTTNRSYVIFEDGHLIEIINPYLPAGGETTVEITETTGLGSKAKLSPTVLEQAPKPGAELKITIQEKTGSTAYAIRDGTPIVLPECPASEGDTLRVAVTEHLETGVEASIAALPAEARPDAGDVLTVGIELPANNSTTTLIHDSIPIEIPDPPLPMEGNLPIKIIKRRANGATGRVDLAGDSDLSEGDQISIESLTHRDDRLVAKHDGLPIVVPLSKPLPSVPDSLPVTVTEIQRDAAYASIRHRREIRSVEKGATITVTTTGRTDQYLIAEYEGCPVWVSWLFDETERPPTLTVEVSEITDCGLFASPPIPDTDASQRDYVFPARVDKVTSDHICASIATSEADRYVFPVTIPVSFDVSGEVGIEVVGERQSNLIGLARTLETGDNATQVPVYHQRIQRTVLAVRERRFQTAAESAREAADASETAVRYAEALRFQIFASGEAVLSNNWSEEQVLDEIATPSEQISSVPVSDAYQNLTNTELEIYERLLSFGTNRARSLARGRQRVADKIKARRLLGGIADRVWEELFEPTVDVEADGWTPEFPHPLLVSRLAQFCTYFESPPNTASKLFEQYSSSKQLQWQIPPKSSPEISPKETVSVVPRTDNRPPDINKSSDEGTAKTIDNGVSDNADSGAVDTAADGQPCSDQLPGTTTEETDTSNDQPESQPATDTDPLAETRGEKQQSAETSGDAELTPTDADGAREDNDVTQNSPISDIESNASATPPTSRLKYLRAEAEAAASDNPIRDTSSTGGGSRYQRAPAIKRYVRARAGGICEACGEPAPFKTPDGKPYLETHHVEELGQGGEDHPDKVAAVCPTCHKRIHYGADGDVLNEILQKRLEEELANAGVE